MQQFDVYPKHYQPDLKRVLGSGTGRSKRGRLSRVQLANSLAEFAMTSMDTAGTAVTGAVGRRKEAAANRAPMACLPCREAKHKCHGHPPAALIGNGQSSPSQLRSPSSTLGLGDASQMGHEAETPCTRCASHSLRCIWLPKAKLGRPRKDTSSGTSTGSTSPMVPRSQSNTGHFDISPVHPSSSTMPDFADAFSSHLSSPDILALPQFAESVSSPSLLLSNFHHGRPIRAATSGSWRPTASPYEDYDPQALADSTVMPVSASWPTATSLRPSSSSDHYTTSAPGSLLHRSQALARMPLGQSSTNMTPMSSGKSQGDPAAFFSSPALPQSTPPLSDHHAALDQRTLPMQNVPIHLDVRPGSLIRRGVALYFQMATRCSLSLLAEHQGRLEAVLGSWATLFVTVPTNMLPLESQNLLALAQAIALMGLRVNRFRRQQQVLDSNGAENALAPATRSKLNEILERQVTPELSNAYILQLSYSLQALLVGCTYEYGLGNIERSLVLLRKASALALAAELHRFDAQAEGHGSAALWLSAAYVSSRSSMQGPQVAEDLRRSFWEICLIEVTLTMCTGGSAEDCLLSRGLAIAVNFPETTEPAGRGQSELSSYALRYRAASLFLEAVRPASQYPSRMDRLGQMLSAITDTTDQARTRLALNSSEQEKEVAVGTYLMLNCACIQLVRFTVFPSLDVTPQPRGLGVSLQEFGQPRAGLDSLLPSGLTHGIEEKGSLSSFGDLETSESNREKVLAANPDLPMYLINASVQAMVEAADNISSLIKFDVQSSNQSSDQLQRQNMPTQGFSPFHSAVHVVAAYGYLAGLSMQAQAAAPWSALTPDHAKLPTVEVSAAQINDNLDTSQLSLQQSARGWPVAVRLAEQVRLCKDSLIRTQSHIIGAAAHDLLANQDNGISMRSQANKITPVSNLWRA